MTKDDRELIELTKPQEAADDKLAELFPEWEYDQRQCIATIVADAVIAATRLEALQAQPVGDSWRCFFCDEVFAEEQLAREHFGFHGWEPGCVNKLVQTDKGRRAELVATEMAFRQAIEERNDARERLAALTASTSVVGRETLRTFARRLDGVPDDTPDIAYLGVEMTHGEGRSVRDAIDAILVLTPVEVVGERNYRAEARALCEAMQIDAGQITLHWADNFLRTLPLSTPVAQGDEVRAALEQIDKFVTDYLSPWGSWKTPWWESEVSDDIEFTDANALKHVAGLVRATLTKGARDAG